jgi:hypothetical protein
MKLELFPIWAGGKAGYLYNVTLDGDLILERSRDPTYDLTRVLQALAIPATSPSTMARLAGPESK